MMPISPQITITPEDITFKSFDISAVAYTSSTATYTATGHTFSAGNIVSITGIVPDGYNGEFTISSIATNTFTVANTTNAAVTTATGNAYWADNTEYSYQTLNYAYQTNSADVTDLVNTNATVAAAYAAGTQAQTDAAAALAQANTAIANAATAYAQANTATFNAGVAQTTADGKNKVHYSTGSPTGGGVNGDLWFTLNGSQNVTAQYTYNGSSWVQNQLTSTVIANLDAGKITSGTITSIAYNNGSGTFSVDASGNLIASAATITGKVTSSDLTVTGTVTSSSATIAGLLTINNAVVTGKAYITQGYLGSASTGWNFSSSGYITNNDNSTIFYPTAGSNTYFVISDRSMSVGGVQSSGVISTTGTAKITGQGTSGNRCEFNYYNTISLHSISSGYGIDTDWAPNSDNTYNLGQATSAGYGANRRWQRLYSNNTTISTSDVRLKKDVSDSPLGLDFITALRPVNYRWITGRQEVVKDANGNGIIIGETPEGKPIFEMQAIPGQRLHYGFIAQEVKAVLDASGVEDFAGWVQDDTSDPDSTQSLSYEQFIAPLVKAVQELTARVKILEGK